MQQCDHCGAEAVQLANGRPWCDAPACIGALAIEPAVRFPQEASARSGIMGAALGLDGLPAAVDFASEAATLAGMDPRAQLDALAMTRTIVLGICGEQQFAADQWALFGDDMMAQARETRAPRLVLFRPRQRPYSASFMALSLATMYVAWIGGQQARVRAHAERIDAFLTLHLGAKAALAIEQQLYAPIFASATDDAVPEPIAASLARLRRLGGAITRIKWDQVQ